MRLWLQLPLLPPVRARPAGAECPGRGCVSLGPWAGGGGAGGCCPAPPPTPSFVTAMSGSPWHQEPPSVHPGHKWGRSQELPSASPAGFKVRRMASCSGVLRVCLSPAGALLACPSFLYTLAPFLSQATCLGSLLGPWQIPCCRSGSMEMKRAPSLTSGCSVERRGQRPPGDWPVRLCPPFTSYHFN